MRFYKRRAPWIILEACMIALALAALKMSPELSLLITREAELAGAILACIAMESIAAYITALKRG